MNRAAFLLLLLLAALPLSLFAGEPTTPEQRKDIIRVTRAFEADPFRDDASVARGLALRILEEASDIKLRINAGMLKELMTANIPDRLAVFGQFILGHAAFVIEHPDLVSDESAYTLAAFTSALHVYRKSIERDAANKIAFWDALSEHQRAGTLKTHVEQLINERKPATAPK